MNRTKGETVRVTFKQEARWFYMKNDDDTMQWSMKMCSSIVRSFVDLTRTKIFDAIVTTTKPRGFDTYHEFNWVTGFGWQMQDVKYPPQFLRGISTFLSRRFEKTEPLYIIVYA